jgi:hypothetical protein
VAAPRPRTAFIADVERGIGREIGIGRDGGHRWCSTSRRSRLPGRCSAAARRRCRACASGRERHGHCNRHPAAGMGSRSETWKSTSSRSRRRN